MNMFMAVGIFLVILTIVVAITEFAGIVLGVATWAQIHRTSFKESWADMWPGSLKLLFWVGAVPMAGIWCIALIMVTVLTVVPR